MNYYNEIKEILLQGEIYDQIKDYSKDRNKVKVYFETGKLLSEAGKHYGKNIIKQYSEKLVIEVGKKYNERTLYRMRKFYEVFNNQKLTPLVSKLTWSHYTLLFSIKNIDEIIYYLNICEKNNLSKRQLQERIKSNEYNRLSDETKNKLIKSEELKIDDLIPNPIIIKSNSLENNLNEYVLKQIILNNLDDFLLQLGSGFSYIGNEYKIKIGDRYNYIDLLLFNIKYNSYVVVELKITEFKVEYIAQVQKYMNYIDKNIKEITNNNTIGIIICKKENKFVIEYYSDNRIMIREYQLI